MRIKRMAAFMAAVFLSIAMAVPTFGAITRPDDADSSRRTGMALSELDTMMASNIENIINAEISPDDQEFELKVLERIKEKISEQSDSLTNAMVATSLIKAVSNDQELSLSDSQWISAFQKACEQYGVPSGTTIPTYGPDGTTVTGYEILDGNTPGTDTDNLAVKKLHILQWNEDGSGVNKSAMKLMIDQILTNEALKNVMGMCMAIAMAMTIAFGLGDIIQQATEKSASTEALWRGFLKICLGIFIIYNCLYVAAFIIYVGTMLLTAALKDPSPQDLTHINQSRTHTALWASVATIEKAGGFSTIRQSVASGNGGWLSSAWNAVKSGFSALVGGAANLLGGTLGGIVDLIGGTLGDGIIQFVMSLSVYAVAINTGVRFVFTPLAVADLFSERFRSSGVRWLKSLAAASLQGVIIFVVYTIGTSLSDILSGGGVLPGFAPVTSLVVYATMIGLFAKSGSIASEIIGAH